MAIKRKIKDDVHSVKRRLLYAICSTVLFVALCFFTPLKFLLDVSDREIRDKLSLFKSIPESEDFVFLGIDSESNSLTEVDAELFQSNKNKEAYGILRTSFPWSRKVYGLAIEKLVDAGAALVLVDVVLQNASSKDPDGDFYLMDVLDKHGDKVVLASMLDATNTGGDQQQFSYVEPYEDFLGTAEEEIDVGYVNFFREQGDEVIRNVAFWKYDTELNGAERLRDEVPYYSLSAMAAKKLGYPLKEQTQRIMLPSTRLKKETATGQKYKEPQEIYPPFSVASIFMDDVWRDTYKNGAFFKNKVVIIGPSMDTFQDKHLITIGEVHGAQLHLHALNAIAQNASWQEIKSIKSFWIFLLIIGVSSAYSWGCIALFSNFRILLFCYAIGLLLALAVMAVGLQKHYLFSALPHFLNSTVCFAAAGVCVSLEEIFRRMTLQKHLGRSMSPEVAAAIVSEPDGYYAAARGRRLPVTILFSDIRGFTSLSEQLEVVELIQQLNVYFDAMVRVIFKHHGTVDKFIGDAIMATWGELGTLTPKEQIVHAVQTAHEMQIALKKVNEICAKDGADPLRIGVGIHHGRVLVGELGSDQRTDFTVIGDAVNLASRLEALTSTLGIAVNFSEVIVEMLDEPERFHYLGDFRVKGKNKAISLYTLRYENAALDNLAGAIKEKNQSQVISALEACKKDEQAMQEAEKLLLFYQHYFEELQNKWDGVFTMTSK